MKTSSRSHYCETCVCVFVCGASVKEGVWGHWKIQDNSYHCIN